MDDSCSMMVDELDEDYFISGKYRVPKKTLKCWSPSSAVKFCRDCRVEFGWYTRKHHCRKCGFVFCNSCCYNFLKIPEYVARPKSGKEFKSEDKVRVCVTCFNSLLKIIESKFDPECIVDFGKDWPVLKNISESYVKYHISKYRDVQYNFPLGEYDTYSKIILWHNRNNFVGHFPWIVRLILCEKNWRPKEKEILEKLFIESFILLKNDGNNPVDCGKLLCGRKCKEGFNLESALSLLNERVFSDRIKSICLTKLSKLKPQELKLYLLYIFDASINSPSDIIRDWLIETCSKNVELALDLFWLAKSDRRDVSASYVYLLEEKCERKIIDIFDSTADFVRRAPGVGEIICDPSNNYKSYKINSISEINSHTAPKKIISATGDGCLVKSESVVKDKIIMNIIRFLGQKEKLKTVTYNVVTTGPTNGIIQLVMDSETVASKASENLCDYVVPSKRTLTLDNVMENIRESLAFSTVLAYALGIGDRHTENIMVKSDGTIFHVDFSYLLGEAPSTLGSPEIRISRNLMAIIPKSSSEFVSSCKKYFKVIRDNITSVKLFLLPLDISPKTISSFLDKKLMPNMKESSAIELFEVMLLTCFNATSLKAIQCDVIDYIHSSGENSGYLLYAKNLKKRLFG